jgi:hypothetical protein
MLSLKRKSKREYTCETNARFVLVTTYVVLAGSRFKSVILVLFGVFVEPASNVVLVALQRLLGWTLNGVERPALFDPGLFD